MPEIIKGPRPLPADFNNPNRIIISLYTLPDAGGLGGAGLSFVSKRFAKCLMGSSDLLIQSGQALRDIYRNQLPDPTLYTDAGFDLWRRNLGLAEPEKLAQIDHAVDIQVARLAETTSRKFPVTIVDSKLFASLQKVKEIDPQLLPEYPHLDDVTLIAIGLFSHPDIATDRVIQREKENGKILTRDEARKLRAQRFAIDVTNNQILYPELDEVGLGYSQKNQTALAHYRIDNSETLPADRVASEMDHFIDHTIRFIAKDAPAIAPTLLEALCSSNHPAQAIS